MLDPLRRDQLAMLPLHRFRAAIVLADEGWCGRDAADERHSSSHTVSDATDQPGVLTQDALMVMVQVRALLSSSGVGTHFSGLGLRCSTSKQSHRQ